MSNDVCLAWALDWRTEGKRTVRFCVLERARRSKKKTKKRVAKHKVGGLFELLVIFLLLNGSFTGFNAILCVVFFYESFLFLFCFSPYTVRRARERWWWWCVRWYAYRGCSCLFRIEIRLKCWTLLTTGAGREEEFFFSSPIFFLLLHLVLARPVVLYV